VAEAEGIGRSNREESWDWGAWREGGREGREGGREGGREEMDRSEKLIGAL